MEMIKETAPHIRRKDSLTRMMLDVIIALSPVIIFALCVYKLAALRNLLVGAGTMILCEFVFVLVTNRLPIDLSRKETIKNEFLSKKPRNSFVLFFTPLIVSLISFSRQIKNGVAHYRLANFLVPLVSGLIYALIMPTSTSGSKNFIYYPLILGAIFGMTIGKLVFGGTGQNIFNPAAVGMVFAKLCFGSTFTYTSTDYFTIPTNTGASSESATLAGTPLAPGYTNTTTYSLLDMLLGKVPGVLGEAFKLAILLGLIYLLVRRAADWRIVFSYIGTFFLLMVFAGIVVRAASPTVEVFHFATYELLGGGLLFGAAFMATDPVTSPITRPGRVIYGCLLGISTAMIRLFGAIPEGVAFSLLLANAATPFIDYYKWSTNKFTWKNILIPVVMVVVSIAIIVWALCGELL